MEACWEALLSAVPGAGDGPVVSGAGEPEPDSACESCAPGSRDIVQAAGSELAEVALGTTGARVAKTAEGARSSNAGHDEASYVRATCSLVGGLGDGAPSAVAADKAPKIPSEPLAMRVRVLEWCR